VALPDPDTWRGEHAPLADAPEPDRGAEPESMVVTVGTGERIHYLDWGGPVAAAEAIMLVHGVAQTSWSWAPVARRLRVACRTIAVDLRGHGLSDAPRSGYDLESLAWDVLTVLTATGQGIEAKGPPAIVAGHGLGAMVAVTMASLTPESVAGVALADGGWEDVAEATRLSSAEFLAGLAEPPEVLASMAAFLADREAFDPASWDADQERAARAQVDQKHAGHVALVTRSAAIRGVVDAMYGYQPMEVAATVPRPLLVLVAESGSADDEAVRERRLALDDVLASHARSGAPARVVRFIGAGHNLMRYRPAEVAAELLALRAVAAAVGQSQR
jgi:pimeloyl-ACP methyl ester carboxylesterase